MCSLDDSLVGVGCNIPQHTHRYDRRENTTHMRRDLVFALLVAVAAYLLGILLPSPPPPSDPAVATLDVRFHRHIVASEELALSSKGHFFRDRDMTFWSLFADNFGANPSTPYMFNTLPLLGFLLPSPVWSLGRRDAVVLIARLPPRCEYFSITTYAMFWPRLPALPFASLGDSVNSKNIKHDDDGLFAYVVTGNKRTYDLVEAALVASGLSASAINLAAVPSDLGLFDDVFHLGGHLRLGTYFEVLARLFRFENQTAGDAYIHSHPPVYYLRANHEEDLGLASVAESAVYRDRFHPDAVDENALSAAFASHGRSVLRRIGDALVSADISPDERSARVDSLGSLPAVDFAPLKIIGIECLQQRTKCLGDGPDCAYFAPHVRADSDRFPLLRLRTDEELHLVTLVHHRRLNSSIYGSIAMVKPFPASSKTLSKSLMAVRATDLGVTSFEFNSTAPFVSWVFTRNAKHCEVLHRAGAVDGCSVVETSQVTREGYLTYCERVYLNPLTALGPHWDQLLPARLFHIGEGDLR